MGKKSIMDKIDDYLPDLQEEHGFSDDAMFKLMEIANGVQIAGFHDNQTDKTAKALARMIGKYTPAESTVAADVVYTMCTEMFGSQAEWYHQRREKDATLVGALVRRVQGDLGTSFDSRRLEGCIRATLYHGNM